jgi:predicted ATPase/class 3 adenylate cyclase
VSDLPSGTVTLLFSDMEGSTRLLTRLGDRYVDALEQQRRILRQAWADCGGTELGTEGDSFYVVFAAAEHGVRAVAQAQRELAAFAWPGDTPVRVRMGLHTGAPMRHDGGYVGIDVHRAARIAASAHGGQIVVSGATAELVAKSLPDGVRLRDLGDHRFKDLDRAERVYQLEVDGLDQMFPPLRSLGTSSTLPVLDGALLGRDVELARLSAWVRDGRSRMLTLTGPGGSGKTCLAIEIARALVDVFPGGVFFVPLASVSDSQSIWGSIADTLDLQDDRDKDDVTAFLRSRRALLVLDNLEQIDGASKVAHQLIAEAREIVVIATSRRPLHIAAEQEFPVSPLEVPADEAISTVEKAAAVQLFVRQARRVRPDFKLVAENAADVAAICRRLDGMPLAIELAAARSKLLVPHALLPRLDRALDLTTAERDRPTRHQTLRATIEWSYQLLAPEQQRFFRSLGVFVGGADLDAVAAVCVDDAILDPLDVVADIVDASMAQIVASEDGEPRILMLETIRSFAAELLEESDERDQVHERHAAHFAHVVESQCALLHGQHHLRARAVLAAEFANVTAALEWLLAETDDSAAERTRLGVGMVAAVGSVWGSEGRVEETVYWFRRAVERGRNLVAGDVGVCAAGLANYLRFSGEDGRRYAEEALDLFRALDQPHKGHVYVLRTMAAVELEDDRLDAARALYDEAVAVARAAGDRHALHRVLSELGAFVGGRGDLELCRKMEQEALDLTIELSDPPAETSCRQNLACTLRLMGHIDEAEEMMTATVVSALAMYGPGELVYIGDDYGAILAETGRDRDAARLLGASDGEYERLKLARGQAQTDEIAPAYDKARARLPKVEWQALYDEGRATPLRAALAAAVRASSPAESGSSEEGA